MLGDEVFEEVGVFLGLKLRDVRGKLMDDVCSVRTVFLREGVGGVDCDSVHLVAEAGCEFLAERDEFKRKLFII